MSGRASNHKKTTPPLQGRVEPAAGVLEDRSVFAYGVFRTQAEELIVNQGYSPPEVMAALATLLVELACEAGGRAHARRWAGQYLPRLVDHILDQSGPG